MYKEKNNADTNAGRQQVGVEKEIFITLWYFANTETYRQISDRFDVCRSSVFRVLHKVVKWIVRIRNLFIKWPTEQEMKVNQEKFVKMKNFPRVIGAIDGCHIRINCPKCNKAAYYNRKKYYSILLQGIVDADKKFIDIHCGEPGSMHDARMFRRSNVFKKINSNVNLIVSRGILLGDSAYPDSDKLVTPFKDYGNLSAKKVKFNYLHSATRIVVENAFGLLKSRFRRLRFFESPSIPFITNCVVAACVLHNICLLKENEIEQIARNEIQHTHFTPDLNPESALEEANSNTKMDIYNELDIKNVLN